MITTVIFDLGGVLIDWNPKYLYRKIFDEEPSVEHFLENICTPDWNEEQDAGRSLQEATDFLAARFPDQAENIRAYYTRWPEMLGGVFEGTVQILRELKESRKYRLYALTNWSAETFPIALERYEFLNWFDGIVVSGIEKCRKPFPAFYHLLVQRYQINPREALFVDDSLRNVKGAEAVGMQAVLFVNPEQLIADLKEKGVLLRRKVEL